MRVESVRAALIGLAVALPGCVPVYSTAPGNEVVRVDPEEAAERAIVGSAAGTALGTGLGAIGSINPAIGAVVGAEVGATLGAAIGVATAQPLPTYKPIAIPAQAVIPEFYDTWPPGYHEPPVAGHIPPPPG